MSKKLTHINRPMTDAERLQAIEIRRGAEADFPPSKDDDDTPPPGIPARVHAARRASGLTRYVVGQKAGVGSTVVRDIEQGGDVPLSQLQAVASVLGLTVELVEQST